MQMKLFFFHEVFLKINFKNLIEGGGNWRTVCDEVLNLIGFHLVFFFLPLPGKAAVTAFIFVSVSFYFTLQSLPSIPNHTIRVFQQDFFFEISISFPSQ